MASSVDPTQALDQYYNAQTQKVNDNYAIGQINNQDAQQASDLSFAQKVAALQDHLTSTMDSLPNSFGARGLLNSGIYNYGGGGSSPQFNGVGFQSNPGLPGSQLGAWQENQYQGNTALSDLHDQQSAANKSLSDQGASLALTGQSDMNSINATEALDASRQAISNAITGA
jgi:hypothetical protein